MFDKNEKGSEYNNYLKSSYKSLITDQKNKNKKIKKSKKKIKMTSLTIAISVKDCPKTNRVIQITNIKTNKLRNPKEEMILV